LRAAKDTKTAEGAAKLAKRSLATFKKFEI